MVRAYSHLISELKAKKAGNFSIHVSWMAKKKEEIYDLLADDSTKQR